MFTGTEKMSYDCDNILERDADWILQPHQSWQEEKGVEPTPQEIQNIPIQLTREKKIKMI